MKPSCSGAIQFRFLQSSGVFKFGKLGAFESRSCSGVFGVFDFREISNFSQNILRNAAMQRYGAHNDHSKAFVFSIFLIYNTVFLKKDSETCRKIQGQYLIGYSPRHELL